MSKETVAVLGLAVVLVIGAYVLGRYDGASHLARRYLARVPQFSFASSPIVEQTRAMVEAAMREPAPVEPAGAMAEARRLARMAAMERAAQAVELWPQRVTARRELAAHLRGLAHADVMPAPLERLARDVADVPFSAAPSMAAAELAGAQLGGGPLRAIDDRVTAVMGGDAGDVAPEGLGFGEHLLEVVRRQQAEEADAAPQPYIRTDSATREGGEVPGVGSGGDRPLAGLSDPLQGAFTRSMMVDGWGFEPPIRPMGCDDAEELPRGTAEELAREREE